VDQRIFYSSAVDHTGGVDMFCLLAQSNIFMPMLTNFHLDLTLGILNIKDKVTDSGKRESYRDRT
jgi:hypothetical protein